MARFTLLLSLLSLALLSSAASSGHNGGAHVNRLGKRCKPKSTSLAPSTSTSPAPSPSPVVNVAPSPAAPTTTSTSIYTPPPPPPTTSTTPAYTPPAPTSTSTTPAPAPSPSPAAPISAPSSGGAKCGLPWPNGDDGTINSMAGKCTWYYTWGPYPVSTTQLEFIPQLWGPGQITDFENMIWTSGAKEVLFLNEPNEPGQSNIDPYTAAGLWQQYMEPLRAKGIRVGSAATSSDPDGMTWTQTFLQACNGGCTMDFIAVHWYDVNAQDFINYVTNWHTTFNLPVWVTEYACQNYNGGAQCTGDEITSFMSTTTSWMDSQSWVERYGWFGMMRNLQGVNPLDALMDANGALTALGTQFVWNS